MRRWHFMAMAGLLLGAATAQPGQVGLIKIDGAIGPATANYIARAVDIAAAQKDDCLILQLNTPGGLLDSMQKIVEIFFEERVPVVVFVAPPGAMATSAGCYITLSANIAAMAPATTIGAAHVVTLEGGGSLTNVDDVMKQKLEKVGVGYLAAIAKHRHRNEAWARSAARESDSILADEALDNGVIDLIAKDVPDLLQQMDGREVNGKTLRTANARIVEIPMTPAEHLFQLFWSPEVMMLLMLVAIYGIIAEMSHPGAIFPGVAGALALILLLYMSATLPVNAAGVALILLAVGLFIIDIFAPTHGVLTGGGIVAFFLGALMLFNHTPNGYHLPMSWIISATLVTAAFFIFVVGKGIRAQFKPVRAGKETMLGQTVNALSRIDSRGGRVFIEGENWNAVSETPVEAGQPVEITGIEGLTLKVKPKN
jgi:membrane-bound serine protease (ClpP class)